MKLLKLTLLLVLLVLASCKKDPVQEPTPPPPPPATDVYAAGYQKIGVKKVATLWKNGQATLLSTGQINEYANSVFVSGNDVYVAGYEDNGIVKPIAKYWKNGEEFLLNDGQNRSLIHI